MIKFLAKLVLITFVNIIYSQEDSLKKKISFTGDFRFRIEQDWDSRKSDGTYRADRTRLRYRLRFGMTYQYNHWADFGLRLRTGLPNKQQDPQLTLGQSPAEFNTLPIGLEKAYFRVKHQGMTFWLGKNTFPFEKRNEIFWSDNVFPEGIAFSYKRDFNSSFLEQIKINTGHFIISTQNRSFDLDSYFQGVQLVMKHSNERLKLYPAFYYFILIPDIPDGFESFLMNYKILHLGSSFMISKSKSLRIYVDYYKNLDDLKDYNQILPNFQDQTNGLIIGLKYGQLKYKGDWEFKCTGNYLERYAAIDFLAQNDWARWDYSNLGSPDGRLTNYKGLEIAAGYAIDKNFNLKMRYFIVEQILPYGTHKETGQRIRLDLNIGF